MSQENETKKTAQEVPVQEQLNVDKANKILDISFRHKHTPPFNIILPYVRGKFQKIGGIK